MTNTVNVREKGKSFDMHISDNLAEVYADGMGYAMLGYPLSKLTFHTVLPAKDGTPIPQDGTAVEQRQAVFRLTMTTASLMEFCQNMLLTLHANKTKLQVGKTQFDNTFVALQSKLDGFEFQKLTPEGQGKTTISKTLVTKATKQLWNY